MAQEMNFWKRLQGETPKFFKRVTSLAITAAAVGTAILTAPNVVPGFVLSDLATKICQYAIVAGIAATVVSQSTVQK